MANNYHPILRYIFVNQRNNFKMVIQVIRLIFLHAEMAKCVENALFYMQIASNSISQRRYTYNFFD